MERCPKTLVVDASVVAKWFIRESGMDKAIQIRDGQLDGRLELIAPDLLVYEVSNALRFRPDIDEVASAENMGSLFAFDIGLLSPSSSSSTRAISEARRLDLSVYDAYYLVTAETFEAGLVTADTELAARAGEEHWVFVLGELDRTWRLP